MDEQLHIIIAGDKGKVLKLPCSRKKLCAIVSASIFSFILLAVTSICSISLYSRNCSISSELLSLKEKLQDSAKLIAQNSKLTEKERLKLNLKVARLELNNIKQATDFRKEKESTLSAAVDELNERSQLIERIIGSIGIKMPKSNSDDSRHSGGLFVPQTPSETDELLFKADKYLNAIRYLPLGRPTKGAITSGFGKREDPINHKRAFHPGLDIRGRKGQPIYATADGVVAKAFRNGGYGNYVQIDHGNGYSSSYAHMQKYFVHKGQRVTRGQRIGLVGNTGRSTGTHLHYEISLHGTPINPSKFMKIASLAKNLTASSEKK